MIFRGDIHETDAIRAEQPFIGGGHHEIRLHSRKIERIGAERLCDIKHQLRPLFAQGVRDGNKVDQGPIGPVIMGQGGDGDILVNGG